MCAVLLDAELVAILMNVVNAKQDTISTRKTIVVLMVAWIVTRLIACNAMKVFHILLMKKNSVSCVQSQDA